MLTKMLWTTRFSAKILVVFFALAFPMVASCEEVDGERTSFGAGYGALFGGVGINVAKVDSSNYRYASFGIISAYRSNYNGQKDSDIAYGVGAGWIKTDIIFPDSGNHGVGLYVGAVGADSRWSDDPVRRESLITRYGGGVNYHYFISGSKSKGLVLGGAFLIGFDSRDSRSNFMATIGYRF